MLVHSVLYYRSKSDTWTSDWNDSHYLARNIVKAVKRSGFRGYSLLKLKSGKRLRVDDTISGHNVAVRFASQMLLEKMLAAGYSSAVIIPVPSSTHIGADENFTGAELARDIERRNSAFKCEAILHFDSVQKKSSAGGGRDTHEIEHHLRLTRQPSTNANVVLLDDVRTTGAHLRAAARYLARHGITVNNAFVLGRTVWDEQGNMFRCETETLLP